MLLPRTGSIGRRPISGYSGCCSGAPSDVSLQHKFALNNTQEGPASLAHARISNPGADERFKRSDVDESSQE